MQKKRLATAIIFGLLVEVANKIAPLLVLRYAQTQLGVEGFGTAQFGMHLVDLFLPFIVFGFHTIGSLRIGQEQGAPQAVGQVVGEVTALKLLHALAAFIVLQIIMLSVPEYRAYHHITTILSFLLFTSALDLSYVHIGLQKMVPLSIFTFISKILSLAGIFLWVKDPHDVVLYAVISFGANSVISCATVLFFSGKFPWVRPRWSTLASVWQSAWPFGLTTICFMLSERYDLLVAEARLGLVGAGLYAGIMRVWKSLQPFVYTLSNVFFSEMLIVKDQQSFDQHVRVSLTLTLTLLAPVAVGGFFVGSDLLTWIVGEEFRQVSTAFVILLCSLLPEACLYVFGQQVLLLKQNARAYNLSLIIGAICGVTTALLCAPHLNVMGIAVGVFTAKAIAAMCSWVYARRYIERWHWRQTLGRVISPALVMGVVLGLLQSHMGALGMIVIGALVAGATMLLVHKDWLWPLLGKYMGRRDPAS